MEATPRVTVSANRLSAIGVSTSQPGMTVASTAGSVMAAHTLSGGACRTEEPEIFMPSSVPSPLVRCRLPQNPVAGRTMRWDSTAWR